MTAPEKNEPEKIPAPEALTSRQVRPPSLWVGMTLLGLAGVLIVIVLINPAMPGWLRVVVAVLAVLVVVVLIGYAAYLFRAVKKGAR